MQQLPANMEIQIPWTKCKLTGQKPPRKRSEIWAILVRLHIRGHVRDFALFNLTLDRKLRACDLVSLLVRDVIQSNQSSETSHCHARQDETARSVRDHESDRIDHCEMDRGQGLKSGDYLFPSRKVATFHITTRQYASVLKYWVAVVGLDPKRYGTHSQRRTEATPIYRRTNNLRAINCNLAMSKWKAPSDSRASS